ncbi:MAG: hypothetical protein KDE50_25950, partial [Caldilineaceae bacterium]|nr:hypothetical protein [Caldilineaceae bacterium]
MHMRLVKFLLGLGALLLLVFVTFPTTIQIVYGAGAPPTVAITAPGQAASFTAGASITLEAATTDGDNEVQQVEFYVDGAQLHTDSSAPWRYVWTGAELGAHIITAVAVDQTGNRTTAAAVDVAVLRQQGADEPYPPSPLILGLHWAPTSSIERYAGDSDNWTLTWADDGQLYSGYGDGRGWEPKVEEKLSMGYVAVSGNPGAISGVNVRSPDEQPYGGGANGIKASGMLMVDNVLYMWARNVVYKGNGCKLAWSTNHAQNWTWSDWDFPDFGYCAFINFGQNYAGARDGYVYMVTPNGPSAYNAYDDFVLTRVPQAQIRNRS